MAQLTPNVEAQEGANTPEVELSPEILAITDHIAQMVGQTLTIKTGTGADPETPSGMPSDHVDGNAVDIEPDNDQQGDAIATAALVVAGTPPQKAAAMAR